MSNFKKTNPFRAELEKETSNGGKNQLESIYSAVVKKNGKSGISTPSTQPSVKKIVVSESDKSDYAEILPELPEREYLKNRQRYARILDKASKDVLNHQPYLGQMMMDALSKTKNFDQEFLDQTKRFPETHALTVLEGFYDSLYSQEGTLKGLAPGKPTIDKNLLTQEEKVTQARNHIEAYRESITSGINLLHSSSNTQQKKLAEELEKSFDSFNKNLEMINQNMSSDSMAEIKRLALLYAKPTLIDTVFLQDSDSNIMLGDKHERRQTFSPILEQIKLPDDFLDVCTRNTNIIQKGLFGHLLQPLMHKHFGAERSITGIDVSKLKDSTIQKAFANDATTSIKTFLNIIDPINKLQGSMSKENFDKLGQEFISKISRTKNHSEIQKIKSEVFAFAFIQAAIAQSGQHFDDATKQKITDKLLPTLSKIENLDQAPPELKSYASEKLKKYVTLYSSLRSEDHKIAAADLDKLASKLQIKSEALAHPQDAPQQRSRSSSLPGLDRIKKVLRPRSSSASFSTKNDSSTASHVTTESADTKKNVWDDTTKMSWENINKNLAAILSTEGTVNIKDMKAPPPPVPPRKRREYFFEILNDKLQSSMSSEHSDEYKQAMARKETQQNEPDAGLAKQIEELKQHPNAVSKEPPPYVAPKPTSLPEIVKELKQEQEESGSLKPPSVKERIQQFERSSGSGKTHPGRS